MAQSKADAFPNAVEELFRPHRYKVMYGGRGSAKSWSAAKALILAAHHKRHRIGCFREIQTSIKDSVHQLLKEQIEAMGLLPWFYITDETIRSTRTGSVFIFKGLKHNPREIKSMEGITIAWIEEAELVSHESWEVLIPTIRKEGSEIWITFNPVEETDSTYVRFVKSPPPNAWVAKLNYYDNPWFSATLNEERLHMLATDPDAYEHVWGGNCRRMSSAVIFKGKIEIINFETPDRTRFYHGADWGFADDPTAVVREWTRKVQPQPEELERRAAIEKKENIKLPPLRHEELLIDMESFGYGVDFEELPALFEKIPTTRTWPIKADNARPETISYMRNQGFNISAAEKWPGCVEDRIAHLRGFRRIIIHKTNCPKMQDEAKLYRWKVDKVTNDVLPIPVDKFNHGWDASGYALDKLILRRGALAHWANL